VVVIIGVDVVMGLSGVTSVEPTKRHQMSEMRGEP
jgi:hypothetical protein